MNRESALDRVVMDDSTRVPPSSLYSYPVESGFVIYYLLDDEWSSGVYLEEGKPRGALLVASHIHVLRALTSAAAHAIKWAGESLPSSQSATGRTTVESFPIVFFNLLFLFVCFFSSSLFRVSPSFASCPCVQQKREPISSSSRRRFSFENWSSLDGILGQNAYSIRLWGAQQEQGI